METDEALEPPEKFDFPFEPYQIQQDFMKSLYETIENRKLGIFESPTGTGKSMSIICGAIRWLKDHNKKIREALDIKIRKLEDEKHNIAINTNDWLSSQSKQIEITHQINELKITQNKINSYDKKIEHIKSNNRKKSVKKWRKPVDNGNNTESLQEVDDNKNIEDDDILLEELDTQEDTDDDEEEEDKYQPTKIFICSRTHSQLSQFIGEILKSPFGNDIRVASLASRQIYCINPEVSKLKNVSLINEKCLDMQKQASKQIKKDSDGKAVKKQKGSACKCVYYKQVMIEELRDMTLNEVQDIEDLIETGKEVKACPYYSSRLAAQDAEIVLVPYNTILHKATREANGINLKNNIVIIDEAHNLLEAMGQMYNAELNYNQLQQALLQVKCYKQRFNTRFSAQNLLAINQLIFVLSKLQKLVDTNEDIQNTFTVENFVITAQIDNYNLFKLTKFCKDSRLAQKVRSYSLKYPIENDAVTKPTKKGIKDFLSSIENKKSKSTPIEEPLKTVTKTLSNPLLAVISFLESLTYSYNDGRIFVYKNAEDKLKTKLQFLLLNPSQNFKDIVQEARSVIVAGGTMKPNNEFRDRLFINSGANPERIVEFSCDHIIPAENILPIIVTTGPNREKLLFNYEHRMTMGATIKAAISEACKRVKGGIVAFFPSYSYESWVWNQIKDLSLGRLVFREPQGSGSVDGVLQKYSEAIMRPSSPGALLLSVVGGKLSEGLNFNDDLGRCVIVVGLPYANITALDLKEKMSYLDINEGSGSGKIFYENLCLKAVNQSIGRAVRHKNDYATILLMDERYNRSSVKNSLPNWIKRSLKVCDFETAFANVDRFFKVKNN